MFGYVTPLKGEMKVKDFERFKCYYCGLCCHIKKQFGNIPRMALNYDMTFLGLLLDSLSPDEVKTSKHLCILHPSQKKFVIDDNKALSYAAAINLSLFYYKLVDDVNDDKDLKSRAGMTVLLPYTKKFSPAISNINKNINTCLNDLSLLEKNKSFNSIDEICDPFSRLVGIILRDFPYELKDDSEELRNNLYSLGYSLGKWIYLIDALDDLKEDIEKKKFNPINFLYNEENLRFEEFLEKIKPKIEFTILNCGYTCNLSLDNLNLNRNKDILYNIIQLGLMQKYTDVIKKLENTDEHKRSDLQNESI